MSDGERHHASGSWSVLWRNADAAVAELREAAGLEPKNAAVQNDLAVALVQRAELKQDPLSILDAYAANDSALALVPNHAEAAFNRALILEQLQLRELAVAQWNAYLRIDSLSAWASEARARARDLGTTPHRWVDDGSRLRIAVDSSDDTVVYSLARRHPRRVRDETRSAIFRWAGNPGGVGATTELHHARLLARAVQRATGDAFLTDLVSSIDSAIATSSPRAQAIATGLTDYGRAHQFINKFEFDSASRWIGQAYGAVSGIRGPLTYWLAYDSATVLYQRAQQRTYDDALAMVDRIRRDAPTKYKTIRGLAARTAGLIYAIRADYDAAIVGYRAAIKEGGGTGDPGLDLRPRGVVASLYANLRGADEGWTELYGALRLLGAYPEELADAHFLFSAAAELSRRRSPVLGLLYQQEAVRLARVFDGPGPFTVAALAKQAELQKRHGMTSRALRTLREARMAADSIASDSTRAIKIADLDLVEGEVWLGERADSAIIALQRAVARYRDTQYLLQINRAELSLASAYASSGNVEQARSAFEAVLSETERQRTTILNSEDRARFLDQARPVIDRVVGFSLDRGDTVGALEYFERMRARVLLERVRGKPARRPLSKPGGTISGVVQSIPRGTRLISYALFDSELVSWLIGNDGVFMHRIPIAEPLARTVNRFSTLITTHSSGQEVRTISSDLYEKLIGPWRGKLSPGTRLVIVPDKSIQFVPFAALYDTTSRHFLVESFEITIAPSISLYRASFDRYRQLESNGQQALVVGNPAFDTGEFPLPDLPGAELEANRVAADYKRSTLLLGRSATKRAFLRAAAASDIVHFAGHGVVTPDAPLLSHLLLAADQDDGSSGALYARELFDVELPRTRLAILSGCETASGHLSATEGASSLARALFAAGVPAVIATLWAVDDSRTAEFFAMYHDQLSRGLDPASALQNTQTRWLANSTDRWGHLSTWAGFQFFGATSKVIEH